VENCSFLAFSEYLNLGGIRRSFEEFSSENNRFQKLRNKKEIYILSWHNGIKYGVLGLNSMALVMTNLIFAKIRNYISIQSFKSAIYNN